VRTARRLCGRINPVAPIASHAAIATPINVSGEGDTDRTRSLVT
jgi:hypothetical protein